MEVMGLMLGEFVDDYTISVVDTFAMPQVSSALYQPTNASHHGTELPHAFAEWYGRFSRSC
jgi:hypothetical protein